MITRLSPGGWIVNVLENRLGLCVQDRDDDDRYHEFRRRMLGHPGGLDGIARSHVTDGAIRFRFENPDGTPESLCGNALLATAALLARVDEEIEVHTELPSLIRASILRRVGVATLRLADVSPCLGETVVTPFGPGVRVDVGTPHVVVQVLSVDDLAAEQARRLVGELGANLSLYSRSDGGVLARTFERGVYRETASCGSGALAIGLSTSLSGLGEIRYPGGTYRVRLEPNGTSRTIEIEVPSKSILSTPV